MAENNSEGGLLAFLLGGAVGVIAGLMLAPRSGAETRERLADWLEENRERTREVLENTREKTREAIDGAREAVGEKKDKINAAWEAGKKAYRESAS